MSEPYSLAFHVPTGPAKFRTAAQATVRPVETFGDWGQLGVEVGAAAMAEADRISPATALSYLRGLRRGARKDLGWYFAVDPKGGYISGLCLLWTDNWTEILSGLNILRQCLSAAGDGRPGYILVHDFVFGRGGTATAVLMREGRSDVVAADAPGVDRAVAHASPVARHVIDTANRAFEAEDTVSDADSLLTDHFPQIDGGN